jgi:hypothetical protein
LQSEAQRAAIQQQQLKAWVAQEDQKFSAATAHESPETMRKISEAAVELAGEYGVSKQELAALWNSQPIMRSSAFQRIMADAARYRLAQKEVVNKLDRSTPPVQRPGVAPIRGNDGEVDQAMRRTARVLIRGQLVNYCWLEEQRIAADEQRSVCFFTVAARAAEERPHRNLQGILPSKPTTFSESAVSGSPE